MTELKILGFLCNWCSYAGADLAGISRIQYPTNLRVIRVMCSGRVDPLFVIRALENGLDGVIIMGCHIGDCHYLMGNYEAEMKFKLLKKLLAPIGFADRVHLEWVSAAEGVRFGQVIGDFTAKIKALGLSPLRDKEANKKLADELMIVKEVAETFRIRALIGRERTITEEGNIYGNVLPLEKVDPLLDDAIKAEFQRIKIFRALVAEPHSVKELAENLQIDSSDVLKHVIVLRQRGKVALDRIEGVTPIYFGVEV